MSTKTLRPPWRAALLLLGALTLAVATACAAATAGTPVRASGTPSPTGTAAAATVMTRTGPHGTYLVDGQGKSLYLFVPDKNGASTCFGPCAAAWPPLTVPNAPTAGPGVTAGMLATINRPDGSKQVTYAGHPLYYFVGDRSAGDTTGQALNNFGGLWWLVTPGGTAITG
jgi:predicted lipoprotein with Yx(FWY)xxD motif